MPRVMRSIVELRKLLEKQEKKLARLERKRNRLAVLLRAADAEIEKLTGGKKLTIEKKAATKRKLGRPRKRAERKEIRTRAGKITLRQAVRQVLAKAASAMRVAEIVKMLPKTGYSSKSKNLSNMVAHVLRESGEFRRVSRGRYGLRK